MQDKVGDKERVEIQINQVSFIRWFIEAFIWYFSSISILRTLT